MIKSKISPKAQVLSPHDPSFWTVSAADLQVAQVPSILEVAHLSETQLAPMRLVPEGQAGIVAEGPQSPSLRTLWLGTAQVLHLPERWSKVLQVGLTGKQLPSK